MASPQIPKTMNGILIEKTGGVEVLEYKTDLPVPSPKDNEVLVKNEVSGVNFIDTYFRTGLYPVDKPAVLGREGAGHIAALGSAVTGFSLSDRVLWSATGGYAEYTAAPAAKTVKIPDAISYETACASFMQGLTALTMTEESYHVERGDWIHITAASGGVGTWLCQILKAKGARTIATVGSEGKAALAKSNGAEVVLVEGQADVKAEIMKLTDGEGVSAVFDGVGKSTFDRSLDCIRRKGTMVSFGNASGAVEPLVISRLAAKNLKVIRPTLYNYIATREEFEKYTNELFNMIIEDKFAVKIHEVYPLKDAARAQSDLEGRHTMGKLLLKP